MNEIAKVIKPGDRRGDWLVTGRGPRPEGQPTKAQSVLATNMVTGEKREFSFFIWAKLFGAPRGRLFKYTIINLTDDIVTSGVYKEEQFAEGLLPPYVSGLVHLEKDGVNTIVYKRI